MREQELIANNGDGICPGAPTPELAEANAEG